MKRKKHKLQKKKKRAFLLLEVLIAFSLVVLCIFPLLTPHLWMIQEEQNLVKEIEADRAASALWVTFVRKLQENKIEWEALLSNEKQEFTSDILTEALVPPRFSYTPSYRILNHKQKRGTHEGHTYHLFDLEIIFTANQKEKKELTFPYSIFLERNLNVSGDKKEEQGEKA